MAHAGARPKVKKEEEGVPETHEDVELLAERLRRQNISGAEAGHEETETEEREMAGTSEHCLVCCKTVNRTSTNTGTDQDTDQRANSSSSLCACKGKQLYPKIHFCGNIIWICSTCIIKGKKCNHCNEDLVESQADTKESLTHNQLFTDLIMAEKMNKILFQSEKKNSSHCDEHNDKKLDFFCCIHNVPVCFDCKKIYHKMCTSEVKEFTESLEKTKTELNNFIKKLESNKIKCDDHLMRSEDQKETINGEITEGFDKLHSYSDKEAIQRHNDRLFVHQQLIIRVLESSPDAAFFDMTQTLAAIVNSIEKDISKAPEEATKRLDTEILDMNLGSSESSHGNVMSTKISNRTLYSNARSVSGPRGSINITERGMSHETENVVYVYTCTKCQKMYVGQTGRKLGDRDYEHRKEERITDKGRYPPGIVHEHNSEHGVEKQNHFVVSCVRKDLDDEDQRHTMERLIMLKLGTLKPAGLNERLPPRAVEKSLEILRFQTFNGANVELCNDDRTAIIKESNGNSSLVLSREVLKSKHSYEVLLEEINNEQATIGVIFKNRGEPIPRTVTIKLPTCTMPCRLGIDFYKQYGYVYVNGIRVNSITLQENFKSKEYKAVFQACSKITGLPIQPQKTWKFAEDAWLTLSDESRTAECRSLGHITSKKPMKLNTLYEIIVDELCDNHNGLSDLGIWIKSASTAPWIAHRIKLIKGSRYGVIVDAQKNLHLILNGEHKVIIRKCVTLPCYFFLWCKGLKVSTLPETKVFFDQEGKIIPLN